MNLNVTFRNDFQRNIFYETKRNQCGSGGFGNGKTFGFLQKCCVLLCTFPGYRFVFARQVFSELKRTTMQTFFKIMPQEFILSHNDQDGITKLKNNSLAFWMHLDTADEQSLRGLEPNSIFIDQAEEIDEAIYLVLDARIGRWDKAEVPTALLKENSEWPLDDYGKHRIPSYMMLATNPDLEFHFIYRYYHLDSQERKLDHIMYEAESDPSLMDPQTYKTMLSRDPEWVDKYVRGKWGASTSQIHRLSSQSILEPSEELIERIKKKGNLFRILDHGESAPTCCLWCAALDGVYIFYREYYVANQIISYHRRNIHDLSSSEQYSGNYADPSIFKKEREKDGRRSSVADEYLDKRLGAPAIAWMPADNNEFATRNRINELLSTSINNRHPLTKESPAPGVYFIKSSKDYPNGCNHSIRQISSQRKKLLTEINGRKIYSDDREDSVEDHAYDCIRYMIAVHGSPKYVPLPKPPRNSFAYFNNLKKREMDRLMGAFNS